MPNSTPLSPKTPLLRKTPRRSAPEKSLLIAQRDEWVREIAPESLFHSLFDELPGLHFFAKNRRGEVMFASRSIRTLYGLSDDAEIVGLTDFDLNPDRMAEAYVKDDAQIHATGKPIIGRIELWWNSQGMPDWYVVTKVPIWSRRGRVIGVMGVSQHYEGRARSEAPWHEIASAVKLIREGFREPLSIEQLAHVAKLSKRQLERKFRAVFAVTPQEFLIKTRVLAACRTLRETDAPLAAIATDCGFYDQSSFTEHFRRRVGLTPRAFRQAAAPQE